MTLRMRCPGKIMLAGEYAVVDGGPALMLAVNAHAIATLADQDQSLSPFLHEVQEAMAKRFGATSMAAMAAKRVVVDTTAFRASSIKLGLGSSAAATVAATALALATSGASTTPESVYAIAAAAHSAAQAALGAKGSGADVATCAFGGCLRFQHGDPTPLLRAITLPPDLHLCFAWTGVAASTPRLVAAVQRYRASNAPAYAKLAARISECAEGLAASTSASQALEAIALAGEALRALGEASAVPLWIPAHETLAAYARQHGGSLKPTGAGGGDLALAAFANAEHAESFRKTLQECGIPCPALDVDLQGVRLHA